jgi:antitoxin ParD1/3/4
MPIEQLNISLSPQMARFIRGKVKKGQYTNISEVVRDAVRHMQVEEERHAERTRPLNLDAKRGVDRGIGDLETGAFQDFDEDGLKDYFSGVNERGRKRLSAGTKQPS